MQCRMPACVGGSLARLEPPPREPQTAKRRRNRVRATGRSRVSGGLGDPHPVPEGTGRRVRRRFGGAPCVRVPAPLMPTPMPPFAPQPPRPPPCHRCEQPPARIDGLVCSARNALRAPRDHSCREVWKQGSHMCHCAKSSSNNSRWRTISANEQCNRDVTPCMPCSFGPSTLCRSGACGQPTRLLGVTVSVRWIPLVTAACGTWVARPARTATALAWWRRFQLDDQVRPVPLIRCPLTTSAVVRQAGRYAVHRSSSSTLAGNGAPWL